jgi:hypothetical protein
LAHDEKRIFVMKELFTCFGRDAEKSAARRVGSLSLAKDALQKALILANDGKIKWPVDPGWPASEWVELQEPGAGALVVPEHLQKCLRGWVNGVVFNQALGLLRKGGNGLRILQRFLEAQGTVTSSGEGRVLARLTLRVVVPRLKPHELVVMEAIEAVGRKPQALAVALGTTPSAAAKRRDRLKARVEKIVYGERHRSA